MSGRGLPVGFAVRVRPDVRRLGDGSVLLGGSPLRALRLHPRLARAAAHDRVVVANPETRVLAERLLDSNLAEPEMAGLRVVPNDEITVVIPIRDRSDQLDRLLASLRPALRCVVVDDASLDTQAVVAVAARHGAEVVHLPVNVGPAGARNAGLSHVETPYVAFVDSDITVAPEALTALAAHFADPRVAMVGPKVHGRTLTRDPRWYERYDAQASSLTLGDVPCSVAPGAAVGWLPSACLVARVDRLGDGFDATMRVGEDVDLVLRLVEGGQRVRYDPSVVAWHETRDSIRGWLGRKVVYGSGGAALAERHGSAIAPARLSAAYALAAAWVLARGRGSSLVAAVAVADGAIRIGAALPDVEGRKTASVRIAARGFGWALRQESALLLRHWWPATAVGVVASRSVRRAVVSALVVDAVVAHLEEKDLDPVTTVVGRRLDDLAYGSGLWLGAFRARSARVLMIHRVRGGSRLLRFRQRVPQ